MPAFAYTARTAEGAAESGTVEAAGRREALAALRARGLRVTDLRDPGEADPAKARGDGPAPDASLRLPFLEALDDLVRGGLSAGEAVRLLSQRLQAGPLRALCAHVWARLGEGQSLSSALATVPSVFDSHTLHLVAAGEATGSLQGVLGRLIQHFNEQAEFRQRLVRAMIYPAVICVVAVGVVAFFVLFLLPRLRPLLDSLGGELPMSARILVALAEASIIGFPVALVAALAGWAWIRRWRRTEAGRVAADAALLRVPLLGALATRVAVLNFCETLASLLENGITTAQALRMAEKSAPNRAIRARLRAATDRVLEGEGLARALGRTAAFPPLLLDRITVAEQTGNLAPGLRDVARSYRAQLDRWLGTLANTFSTVVLVGAFALVGLIAFAIVSAVFSVGFRL
jgi:general secretion pathway protein F